MIDHKNRRGLTFALLALLFLLAAAALGFLPTASPDAAPGPAAENAPAENNAPAEVRANAIVTHVIDGDTLTVGGRSVRLLGVDAPERGRCFYEEAKQELARLTFGRSVRLEGDPLNDDADEYGRLLRYIYLTEDTHPPEPDGTLVNAALIEGGFARHLSWFPNEKNARFAELEAAARAKNLGLWAGCGR